jgi:nucleoid-associated protein YgaU
MELPKHTTQVGTIAANKKMYLEDYCISYMKQLTEEFSEERKQIALYGIVEKEKNVEYAFVYGAALLGTGKGRTDSLTSNQKDEAEIIREEYFSDYQLVGIVISTDAVNENVFWLGYGNKAIPMDGYYIFYDTNEAMLNFMMHNQKEERDIDLDPVIIKKADMDRVKREKADREKLEEQQKSGKYRKKIQEAERNKKPQQQRNKNSFPAAACVLLLAIGGVYGMKTFYPEFGVEQVKGYVLNLKEQMESFGDSYLKETEEVLVENLVEEIEKEDMVVVSTAVQQPAEMDVVIIPNLDELEKVEESPVSSEIPIQESEGEEKVIEETEEEPKPQEYFIKKGDNLLRILRAHYGNESKLQEVIQLNGIVDPNNIQVGQTILLP